MKRKRSNRFLAIIATFVLAILVVVPVMNVLSTKAAKYAQSVTGPNNVTFTKYLVIPNNLTIPAKTFTYTVTAGTEETGSTSKMPVYAGNDSGRTSGFPTAGIELNATFTDGETTTPGVADDGIANDTDHKYASKPVTIDLSGVTYSEPGIYRYIVTENQTVAGISYDTNAVRTLDVYVEDNNGSLVIAGQVMYYGTPNDTADTRDYKNAKKSDIEEGNKCNTYVNAYPSHNLYIGKKVSGNQGSKDKYFRFIITITNPGKNSTINVTGQYDLKVAQNVNGATVIDSSDSLNTDYEFENPVSLTSDDDGNPIVAVFYLQNNQYINLMGIPTGATYKVEENNYESEGYTKQSADSASFEITNSSTSDTITFSDPTEGSIGTVDIKTGFTNTKAGVIPTGVILSVAPWVVAGIVVIGGIVFFAIRSRRKYEEQ